MTDKDFVLTTMREYGMRRAQDLQETSEGMTGTELYEKEDYIPDFSAAVAKKNMLERKAGKTDGFLCRSSAGRIVRLIQNYNSDTYPHTLLSCPDRHTWPLWVQQSPVLYRLVDMATKGRAFLGSSDQ